MQAWASCRVRALAARLSLPPAVPTRLVRPGPPHPPAQASPASAAIPAPQRRCVQWGTQLPAMPRCPN